MKTTKPQIAEYDMSTPMLLKLPTLAMQERKDLNCLFNTEFKLINYKIIDSIKLAEHMKEYIHTYPYIFAFIYTIQ